MGWTRAHSHLSLGILPKLEEKCKLLLHLLLLCMYVEGN